jgi:3-deoxy-7-phosphoheptulonate synthase
MRNQDSGNDVDDDDNDGSDDRNVTDELFTSHEGLLLEYEAALTRPHDPHSQLYHRHPHHNRHRHQAHPPQSGENRNQQQPQESDSTATSELQYRSNGNDHEDVAAARTPLYYNVGAHFLWVGERTRQLGGAHLGACDQMAREVQ